MTKHNFLNRLRSLFNIDGDLLPELTAEQQHEFVHDPVRYFIGADKDQSDAIWREVEKRQPHRVVTSYVHPPIPVRLFDWCAYYDGEEETGRYGWGRTEDEAIAELRSNWPEGSEEA